MLVDLGRNDLGRVCAAGHRQGGRLLHHRAVQPRHAHRVDGDRPARAGPHRLRRAGRLLPGRARCPARRSRGRCRSSTSSSRRRRGVYGGVVGYLDFAGDADTAITIRTALVAGGIAHVQAGAGVVADSVPANEDAECQGKAAAVISAVGAAATLRPVSVAEADPATRPAAGRASDRDARRRPRPGRDPGRGRRAVAGAALAAAAAALTWTTDDRDGRADRTRASRPVPTWCPNWSRSRSSRSPGVGATFATQGLAAPGGRGRWSPRGGLLHRREVGRRRCSARPVPPARSGHSVRCWPRWPGCSSSPAGALVAAGVGAPSARRPVRRADGADLERHPDGGRPPGGRRSVRRRPLAGARRRGRPDRRPDRPSRAPRPPTAHSAADPAAGAEPGPAAEPGVGEAADPASMRRTPRPIRPPPAATMTGSPVQDSHPLRVRGTTAGDHRHDRCRGVRIPTRTGRPSGERAGGDPRRSS